jgi:hypothetical protein
MPKGHQVAITPQQDEIIRKCWENNVYGHHAAKRAAQLAGITLEVAQRRATQLGLIFTRERHRWSEAELKVVEQHAHLALDTIQRKLRPVSPAGVKRTRAAIAKQIFAQRFRGNMDGLKHEPLAQALGISGDRLHKLRAARLIAGQRLESIREACGHGEAVADEHRHWFYPKRPDRPTAVRRPWRVGPAQGKSDMADGTPGVVHNPVPTDPEGAGTLGARTHETGAAQEQEAAAARERVIYQYAPPAAGPARRLGGGRDQGREKSGRNQTSIDRRCREIEERQRRGDIAFRYPIFWTCWRTQCRLAYRRPR